MGGERDLIRRILKRPSTHDEQPRGGIPGLNKEQRVAYPTVIYQLESDTPYDLALVRVSLEAISAASLDFQVALDIEGKDEGAKVVVRANISDRHQQTTAGVLFLGLTEATRVRVETGGKGSADLAEYRQVAQVEAEGLLQTLVGKPKMYEAFKKFYGGLRWGTDQEKFTRDLFVHGTDFDLDFLEKNLSGGNITTLTYDMGLDLPYEETGRWYEATAEAIFEKFPQLDYHRLEDPEFRLTPEGQKLFEAYSRLGGKMLADRHERRFEVDIDQDEKQLPRVRIPLSRHPIVEALIVHEVAFDRPKAKYDMGAKDWTGFILESDSVVAHEALVTAINTRVAPEYRHVFDGPREFQHKHGDVGAILSEYRSAAHDDETRQLLKQDLLKVLDAFTGEGEIASSVRSDYESSTVRDRKYMSELGEVKDIVKSILCMALAAPDPEVIGKAEELISTYVSDTGSRLTPITEKDPLSLDESDLMLVTLDALENITAVSRPAVFEVVGTRVFGSPAVGAQLRGFAEAGVRAAQIRTAPDALKTSVALRKFSYSIGKDKSPEEIAARKAFNDAVEPAEQLWSEQKQGKNRLLITFLNQIAGSGALEAGNTDAAMLFEGFVDRVEFRNRDMIELPPEYHELIKITAQPNLPENQNYAILWRIKDQFKHVDSKSQHLLVTVVMDMMQAVLGPVGAVRLPTRAISRGLSAISEIVQENGGMFKAASQDQLDVLSSYAVGIMARADQIGLGAMLTAKGDHPDINSLLDWQKETLSNLSDALRELKRMGEYYEKYQRVELVKVFPHVYYPWLLEKFVPFWKKMGWEVSSGNRPTRDISGLYRVLEDHVRNKLVFRKPEEYPEGFDAVEEGHIDTLIKAGYDRMVVPHDIKYNSTVWQEGLTFVHYAVGFMPEVVFEQMRDKYPNSDFVRYLEKERARWQDEGNQ